MTINLSYGEFEIEADVSVDKINTYSVWHSPSAQAVDFPKLPAQMEKAIWMKFDQMQAARERALLQLWGAHPACDSFGNSYIDWINGGSK